MRRNDYETPLLEMLDTEQEGCLCASSEDLVVDDSWNGILK